MDSLEKENTSDGGMDMLLVDGVLGDRSI